MGVTGLTCICRDLILIALMATIGSMTTSSTASDPPIPIKVRQPMIRQPPALCDLAVWKSSVGVPAVGTEGGDESRVTRFASLPRSPTGLDAVHRDAHRWTTMTWPHENGQASPYAAGGAQKCAL